MATRMQQRRGTAAQWISTNSGNGPILNAGEIGWESDTNKFKMGDGTNTWLALDYFADINSTVNPAFGSSITFEGATANDFETILAVTDPTADRTITLPNVTGTVITTGNLSDITNIGVFTSSITMEGSTADDHELTLSAGNPTADRTITFPDAAGTVALVETVNTSLGDYILSSLLGENSGPAELNGSGNLLIPASSIIIEGATSGNGFETTLTVTDPTADRTITFPNNSGTVALTSDIASGVVTETGTQTLTNKTLTSPVIATVLNGAATITMPTITGTVALTSDVSAATGGSVSETGTQTLSNKSISLGSNTITSTLAQLNTAVSDADVASLAGSETLTNKTISIASNTLTGVAPLASPTFTGTVTIPSGASISGFAPLESPALTGTATAVNLTLSGDLTVNGTTTNINSTNLVVEDKNIVLGDTTTPTDVSADGGGITLKGGTDKTFNWVDATDAWTSSEHINLASGKTLKYNGTDLVAAQSGNSGKFLTTDGTATSWATVSGYSAPTLGSTSIASGATVTTITGLTLSGATLTGTLTAGGGAGTSGQVLASTGSGVQWTTPAGGAAFSELLLIGA